MNGQERVIKKEYLACFDLDGTLFDTGDVNYYAYKQALKSFGIELEKEFFIKECNGRHYKEFLPVIMGNSLHLEEVHKAKKIHYAANLDRARVNVHLLEIIQMIKEKYYIALVTTASRQNALDLLTYYGYENLFEYIVTQEDITEMKPSPQGFLKVMKYFEVDAYHTVIFEDSDVGTLAARATGATVIVVDTF